MANIRYFYRHNNIKYFSTANWAENDFTFLDRVSYLVLIVVVGGGFSEFHRDANCDGTRVWDANTGYDEWTTLPHTIPLNKHVI